MNALDAMECGPQRRWGAEECLLGDWPQMTQMTRISHSLPLVGGR